jgi:hypothetical protein
MPGIQNIVAGLIIGGIGIAITAVTYEMASGGGTYVVAWGAVLVGAVRVIQGFAQLVGSAVRRA